MSNEYDEISQKIADLNWDMTPENDLWPDIEAKLPDRKKKNVVEFVRNNTMPLALAASILVAVVSVFFNMISMTRVEELTSQQLVYQQQQLEHIRVIEQQHKFVRAQLLALISRKHDAFDPQLVSDIRGAMQAIDIAAAELKSGVMLDPANSDYTMMLAQTYQQEKELLEMLSFDGGNSI